MTQNMEQLRRSIRTADDLQSVVTTMKALASVSIRQYQEAVRALDQYNETIELGLSAVLKNRPHTMFGGSVESDRLIAVVFGSDQGLVGQFNDRVVRYAVHQMNEAEKSPPDERTAIAIGLRVVPFLEDAGQAASRILEVPSSEAGIAPMVMRLLSEIDTLRREKAIERIVLYYNRPTGGASYRPTRINLLPLKESWLEELETRKWESRAFPIATMDWERLFTQLIQQYFFVSLYRAMANSLASENASRLASMENAETNIEERLDELNMIYKRERQTMITEELFDVIAGFEALRE
jgi:F-type H+-transporting ATPase subunit gamma